MNKQNKDIFDRIDEYFSTIDSEEIARKFRNFISKYPLVKQEVLNGNRTWQQIYEDWVLLGEQDSIFDK